MFRGIIAGIAAVIACAPASAAVVFSYPGSSYTFGYARESTDFVDQGDGVLVLGDEFTANYVYLQTTGTTNYLIQSFAFSVSTAGTYYINASPGPARYSYSPQIAVLLDAGKRYDVFDFLPAGSIHYLGNSNLTVSGIGGTVTVENVTLRPTDTVFLPEPTTWAMMIGGLGMAGAAMRRRRAAIAAA